MSQAIRQVNDLTRQIAESFRRAACSPSDILTGPIKFTDTLWSCPAVDSEESLADVPLNEYLYYHKPVNTELFAGAWRTGLHDLRQRPSRTITQQGWRVFDQVLSASSGQKALWFSTPENFPTCTDSAGVIFSIECAAFLKATTPLKAFHATQDDYWAETLDGQEIGVRDGLPIHDCGWDTPHDGQVALLVAAPRGEVIRECRYDSLARVRSFVEEHFELFPRYSALLQALQMLYFLTRYVPSMALNNAILQMYSLERHAQGRMVYWGDAISIMEQFGMSDRQKILSLHNLLVPDLLSPGEFNRNIFKMTENLPAVLTVTKERNILQYLRERQDKDAALCNKPNSVRW